MQKEEISNWMSNSRYGNYYWIVEVSKIIAADGWISCMGDTVEISNHGDLMIMNHSSEGEVYPGLIIPQGQWISCYAASMITGDPIVVDHWINDKPYQKSNNQEREKLTPTIRYRVLSRDNYTCQSCGKSSKETTLHVDHIIPISKGGKTEISNLQVLCSECNQGKSDKVY